MTPRLIRASVVQARADVLQAEFRRRAMLHEALDAACLSNCSDWWAVKQLEARL